MRFQRAISHPFTRVKVAHTRRPPTVPTTRAFCGPPYTWVHAIPLGVDAKSAAPPAASRAHALAGLESGTPAGSQCSVHTTWAAALAACFRYVIRYGVSADHA